MTDIEVRMDKLEQRVLALEKLAKTSELLVEEDECAGIEIDLVKSYGRYVSKTTAAKILHVTRSTVYAMLEDYRLIGACGGKRVSTRSIARFICSNKRREKEHNVDEDS